MIIEKFPTYLGFLSMCGFNFVVLNLELIFGCPNRGKLIRVNRHLFFNDESCALKENCSFDGSSILLIVLFFNRLLNNLLIRLFTVSFNLGKLI